jgi:hypothetical protein
MCHKDPAFEIGFRQYIWKRSCMVDVETLDEAVSNVLTEQSDCIAKGA